MKLLSISLIAFAVIAGGATAAPAPPNKAPVAPHDEIMKAAALCQHAANRAAEVQWKKLANDHQHDVNRHLRHERDGIHNPLFVQYSAAHARHTIRRADHVEAVQLNEKAYKESRGLGWNFEANRHTGLIRSNNALLRIGKHDPAHAEASKEAALKTIDEVAQWRLGPP